MTIWDINHESAAQLKASLEKDGFSCTVAGDLDKAVPATDIISAFFRPAGARRMAASRHARRSNRPFTPSMRESDDKCVEIADVYIDTQEAMHEVGDLIQPTKAGTIDESHITARLSDPSAGLVEGRKSADSPGPRQRCQRTPASFLPSRPSHCCLSTT
ncbi:hypothetical protein [Ensifer sp. LCM 4579]|uniref:hypothetical protein n=1 Tax=Ensifer sp. LCM 4579 TaxID=1848292 RepID=UPI001FCDC96D|nr:hypothetical protein [Ensifer sp. LCM 4579]